MPGMTLKKLTPLLVVDDVTEAMKPWLELGYAVSVSVPDEGPPGFVILSGAAGELMLQSKASLADDMPVVAKKKPKLLLYADVSSLAVAKKDFKGATVL